MPANQTNPNRDQPLLRLESIVQRPGLKIEKYTGKSERLIVCFSGVGSQPDVDQPIEFVKTATNNGKDSALFIRDTNRTWLNGDGLIDDICAAIENTRQAVNAKSVFALGNSMGGFSALIIPYYTDIDVSVAFSPQFSVDPAIVPTERRWKVYTSRIKTFHIPSVEGFLTDRTRYFVFHGLHHKEDLQRGHFERRENLEHYYMENTSHNSPIRLKKSGVMDSIVQAAFAGKGRRLRILMKQVDGSRQ